MRVLFAASEGLPFIKTGGLADVIGSLPKILKENGVDVRVVLPMYKKTAEKDRANFENVGSCEIHSGNIHTVATYYKTEADGIPYYFIEHAGYFERDTLYGYDDDGERFAFFDKAVLEMFRVVGWMPEVVHCHDWQTGMIPAVCKAHYPYDGEMQNLKFVYTIHNLLFQGIYPASRLWDYFGLPYEWYENGTLRFHDNCISYLKAGVVLSDKITTVSPTYSQEILTPYFGEKMEDVLRMRSGDLSGIVNGIDMDVWDPATDKTLTEEGVKSALTGVKIFCIRRTPLTFTSLFLSASSTSDELTQMPADAIPLSEIQFADNNWSIEEAVYDAPEADANGVITPTAVTGQMRIQYSLDAAEQIDTLQKEYQALEARVTALENA